MSALLPQKPVRPEPVEGLPLLLTKMEGQGFDKLSPNGCGGCGQ